MQNFLWLELVSNSIDGLIHMINENTTHWNIDILEEDGVYFLGTGDQAFYSSESREMIDAVLYGIALDER